MAEPIEQAGTSRAQGKGAPGQRGPGAGGWDVVARAIHTAQVFNPEGVAPTGVGSSEVSLARWELAVGAHGAAGC